jgi:hypothetical protein
MPGPIARLSKGTYNIFGAVHGFKWLYIACCGAWVGGFQNHMCQLSCRVKLRVHSSGVQASQAWCERTDPGSLEAITLPVPASRRCCTFAKLGLRATPQAPCLFLWLCTLT